VAYRDDRASEPCGAGGAECAGRQFHDKCGAGSNAVVLPAHDAARLPGKAHEGYSRESGEAALDGGVAARFVDDVEVLVEPDRDAWTDRQDQLVRDQALRLGEWVRAGVVRAVEVLPAPWEVAVEINTVGVTPACRRRLRRG
jgi:hypothetical protein